MYVCLETRWLGQKTWFLSPMVSNMVSSGTRTRAVALVLVTVLVLVLMVLVL